MSEKYWRKMNYHEEHTIKVGKKLVDDCCRGLRFGYKFFEDVLSVYIYLHLNVKQNFEQMFSDFSLSDAICFFGRKQRRNSNAINERVIKALRWLVKNNYIWCSWRDFENAKPKDLIRFSLYPSYISEYDGYSIGYGELEFNVNGGYILISVDEVLSIRRYCLNRNKSCQKILLELACVRKEIPARPAKCDNAILMCPEVFLMYYPEFSNNTGLSEYYVKDIMDILEELNIFYVAKVTNVMQTQSIYLSQSYFVCEYKKRDNLKNLILEGESYYCNEIEAKKSQLLSQ